MHQTYQEDFLRQKNDQSTNPLMMVVLGDGSQPVDMYSEPKERSAGKVRSRVQSGVPN